MALTLRIAKGSRLTWAEADANWSGLADGSLLNAAALAAKTFTALALSSTLTVAGQVKAGDGTAAAPAYSFSANTNKGFYSVGTDSVSMSLAGVPQWRSVVGQIRFRNSNELAWAAGDPDSTTADVILARDAANTLAQRNGVNAQTFRIYNTFTDASNYERLGIAWESNVAVLSVRSAGTGAARTIAFEAPNGVGGFVTFGLARADQQWNINLSGHLVAGTDNTYDIGASGASRPRSIHAGTAFYGQQLIADPSTPLEIQIKATGGNNIRLWTSLTDEAVRIVPTTSTVNYVYLRGSATGGQVNIGAGGADTNINTRVFTQGTGQFEVITNGVSGSRQFTVEHTASAVNYIAASGGVTAGSPQLNSRGADTNVGMVISTKGTGIFQFLTAGQTAEQFRITHTASAVNYAEITGGAAGTGPRLRAQGTDADVVLTISSKGTAYVSIGTNAGATEQFRVSHVASAVNFVNAAGGATGNGVTVDAQGSDTNVSLTFASKGTGSLILQPNSGDIRWNKANVALGGGATPTFGTIGGSGPAAAAQRNWLRFLESDGTASFIPVWR